MPKKKATRKKCIPPGRRTPVPGRPDRDRRVRQHDRIARVLGVLNLIQSRARWGARAIANELGVSERTVYRDLEVLEFAGVPWYFDETELCYRLRSDIRFPTLSLTDDEALGQAVATALSKAPNLAAGPGAAPTTRKLAAKSSEQTQQLLADGGRLIEVFSLQLADHSKHLDAAKTVQFAVLQQKKLAGTYGSPYEPKPRKLVLHPYRLCLIKAAWYIVGRIECEQATKSLRVARFKTLRMLDESANVPEDFDLREFLGNAWAVYRGDTTYQVQLHFTPEAARVVTETIWHHTQQVRRHRDGSATLRLEVDGLEEVLHWLLSWAGRVRVEEPEELRELYLHTLRDAVERQAASDRPEKLSDFRTPTLGH
jgi:predicted DNA-binding transcriptional regulator YafY